jgi:CheY-like chemotaxis protein
MKLDLWIRILISAVAMALAFLRLILSKEPIKHMDNTFILLFIIAILALVIPWDRLISFKAAGVEVELEQPQVQGALAGMLDAQPKQLQELLKRLAPKIEQAKDGRVLWIDDKPHNIVGERRLLRSLGIEIVTTKPDQTKTEPIMRKIEEDNDFDLIISDIQWRDNQGQPTYGGIEFIKEIREKHSDPVIASLPVIFYTGYAPDQVSTIIKQVGVERFLKFHFCHSIESLIENTIRTIAESRSNPIKVGKKRPT